MSFLFANWSLFLGIQPFFVLPLPEIQTFFPFLTEKRVRPFLRCHSQTSGVHPKENEDGQKLWEEKVLFTHTHTQERSHEIWRRNKARENLKDFFLLSRGVLDSFCTHTDKTFLANFCVTALVIDGAKKRVQKPIPKLVPEIGCSKFQRKLFNVACRQIDKVNIKYFAVRLRLNFSKKRNFFFENCKLPRSQQREF